MTEQEAIRRVKKLFKLYVEDEPHSEHYLYADAVKMLEEALEKQIAKEPKLIKTKYSLDKLLCPTCGEDIYTDTGDSYVDYPMEYCDNCGQKIKLGGE